MSRDASAQTGASGWGTGRLVTLGWLTLAWILLWGTWSWANLLGGLVVAVAVTTLLPLPPITEPSRPRPGAVLRFFLSFLRDLAVSSSQVAWQAVRPGGPVRSAIIAVPVRSDSDLLLTLTAETLTLVPGSMVFDIDRENRILYVHALPVTTVADVERLREEVLEVEARVIRAFGTDRDLATLDRRPPARAGGGSPVAADPSNTPEEPA